MIKAVIFDIDGVLLDSFEANFKFFDDLLRKFGHTPPLREEYQKHFGSNMMDIIREFSKLESEEEVLRIWEAGRDRIVPYPDHLLKTPRGMEDTIEILKKDYTLGIVTSREKAGVYSMPQLASLQKYFKVLIAYQDTEQHKPHPAPLFLAASKLNVKPAETVYIGDTTTDIMAAHAAGMKAILFSRENVASADAHTDMFSKLPEIIKKM